MAAMLGVVSGRIVRSFEIQVAKATKGQQNGSAEKSRQIQCQMLDVTGVIQFTPNIFGSQPLHRGHINRQMCLQFSKEK